MKAILSLLLLLGTVWLHAQNDLPDGQIEVIKGFEVTLTKSTKIRIVPQPIQLDSSVRRYDYQLLAPSPSIDYLVPEIKPLAIQPEKKPLSYPFYAKAGYGSPNSLLGTVSYDHVGDGSLYWGIDLSHLSANNKKIPLQKFSDTRGRINGSYQLNNKVAINGYLDGHFETVYFYGTENIPPNEESLKRAFNRYDAYVEIEQAHAPETSLNYKGFLQYVSDKDDLGSNETGFKLGGEVGTTIGLDEFPLGVKVLIDHSKMEHTEQYALNNKLIQPFFDYTLGSIKFHLSGIVLLNEQNNEMLPDLAISYFVANSRLTLEAGWKGDVVKNNFHFLSDYNPYVNTRLDSLMNMVSRRLYGKVKGSTGSLSYDLEGNYTAFSGMSFFLQNRIEPAEFDVLYDSGHYFGVTASVGMEVLKHVDLRAQFYQRFYTLENEAKPWHRPSSELSGEVTYHGGGDTYHVSMLANFRNGLPYRTIGGTEDFLKPLLDISLHGDYYFTPALGAFVEVNNVLGNKSERWAAYPSYGFNAKAGVLYRM